MRPVLLMLMLMLMWAAVWDGLKGRMIMLNLMLIFPFLENFPEDFLLWVSDPDADPVRDPDADADGEADADSWPDGAGDG